MTSNRIQLTKDLINPERNYRVPSGMIFDVRERLAKGGVVVTLPFGLDVVLPPTYFAEV